MKSIYEDDVELLIVLLKVLVRTHYVVSIRTRVYVHTLFVVACNVIEVLALLTCANFKI